MSSPLQTPKAPSSSALPSRRTGAILAALMLAAGIALGALIGPGPAVSLASSSRAASIARALTLLVIDDSAGANGALLGAAHTDTSAAVSPKHTTTGTPGAAGKSAATASETGIGGSATSAAKSPASSTAPASREASPTPKATPTPAAGGGESEAKPKPLPPIAQVWLIVLPYGQSFSNALGQPSAAPYLDGQLVGKGTLLSEYSALAGSQLVGAATLLSGQVAASVSVLSPPACATTAGATGSTGTAGAPSTASTQGAAGTAPCPSGEPAGLQAADGFVRETVTRITATAGYREHGLIAITFAPASGSSSTTAPAAGTTDPTTPAAGSPTETSYPAGTSATSLSASGSPAGVLLLSPFLRQVGRRVPSAFDAAAPHRSLEEVLLGGGHSG
jgi:hypothetical protein